MATRPDPTHSEKVVRLRSALAVYILAIVLAALFIGALSS